MHNRADFIFSLRIQLVKFKNDIAFELKILSMHSSSSRNIDKLDCDTAVERRCLPPDAQLALGASLRGQMAVGWLGFGPRDHDNRYRRAPLHWYVRADYRSRSSRSVHVLGSDAALCQIAKYQRQVHSRALGTFLRHETGGS